MKANKSLLGFRIFSATTGMPITNRTIAITNDGRLLLEMSSNKNTFVNLPKQGDFIITYGDGRLEIW